MLTRSQELQEWIASCGSKETVKQRLRELTPALKSELLEEALRDDRVYFVWVNNLKDVKKEIKEWIALEKYCEYDEILGSVKMELSGWNDGNYPTSNIIATSSLFHVQNKKTPRKKYYGEVLFSRSTTTIEYTGEELYQDDLDVLLCLIKLAEGSFNESHSVGPRKLLKMLGSPTDGRAYERLEASLKRLRLGAICIVNTPKGTDRSNSIFIGQPVNTKTENFRKRGGFLPFNLIKDLVYIRGFEITFELDSRYIRLFANNEYGLISIAKRRTLGCHDLAKMLQCLISGQRAGNQFHKVEKLHQLSGMQCERKDFLRSLTYALEKLKKAEIISTYKLSPTRRGEAEKQVVNVVKFSKKTSNESDF